MRCHTSAESGQVSEDDWLLSSFGFLFDTSKPLAAGFLFLESDSISDLTCTSREVLTSREEQLLCTLS